MHRNNNTEHYAVNRWYYWLRESDEMLQHCQHL